ncbi:MAG TPA: helix-turn-helix domain-containing protein, partial [Streptosporangiaceae bacterium]
MAVQEMNLTGQGGAAQAPGMRGYGQFCPVALGAEVFAERWTPLILRELLAGSHRFSELQRGLPGIPRALLTQRLGSLQRAGLVERRPARAGRGFEYHLSPAALSFSPVVEALGRWGYQWAAEQLRPDNLDAGLLMWFLRRRVQVDRLPAEQVTVQFEFRDADKRCFWLVLPREQAVATHPRASPPRCWPAAPSPRPATSASPASSWPPVGR